MKKIIKSVLVLVVINLILTGCSSGNDTNEEMIKIVATIFPQYDWVKEIIGEESDNIEVMLLLENGVDLHSYQPTSDDIIAISECDIFIYVGGESDAWVEDVLKNTTNEDMVVINLMQVLSENVKAEEIVEGMEHDNEDHDHDTATFEDSEVQDRELSDWLGDWQSVYPYLLNGTLNTVMEFKAEENQEMTAEDYYEYYKVGYETDIERIVIEGNTITFYQNGVALTAEYAYKGYQILTNESGSKEVRYLFEATELEEGTPIYVQFSDHEIQSTEVEHFHLYFGNEGFDGLLEETDHWPTYFNSNLDADGIVNEMLNHNHSSDVEYDEHVWLSLNNAQIICEYIAHELIAIDSSNTEKYRENVESYLSSLKALNNEYTDALENTSYTTLIFGDRFPFRYLVDDYHLDYYAAFSGCSTEAEASFDTIVFLATKLDELGVKNIIVLENSNQSIAETIIQNTSSKDQTILVLNSLQSITASDIKEGANYLSLMKDNLEVLKKALK